MRPLIADPRSPHYSVGESADRRLVWDSAETVQEQIQAQTEPRSLSFRKYFIAERTLVVVWKKSRC